MKRYRLYEAFKHPEIIDVVVFKNKRKHHTNIKLEPGKIYETDDEFLIKTLGYAKLMKPYSKQLEDHLTATDTPYSLVKCNACGGNRGRKLEYKVVKIYET